VLAADVLDHGTVGIRKPQNPNNLRFGESLLNSSLLFEKLQEDSLPQWPQSFRLAGTPTPRSEQPTRQNSMATTVN